MNINSILNEIITFCESLKTENVKEHQLNISKRSYLIDCLQALLKPELVSAYCKLVETKDLELNESSLRYYAILFNETLEPEVVDYKIIKTRVNTQEDIDALKAKAISFKYALLTKKVR